MVENSKGVNVYASKEKRDAFLNNLSDPRHGTCAGYNLAYCKCEPCVEYREERNRQRREKDREKRAEKNNHKKKRTTKRPYENRVQKDCCTVDEIFIPMLGKPSVYAPYCVVCGSHDTLDQHHPVKRSEGKCVVNGKELKKPTITLCRKCHDLLHVKGLLYFRWNDREKPTFARGGLYVFCGTYEYLLLTEEERKEWIETHPLPNGKLPSKIGYMNALDIPKWERIK